MSARTDLCGGRSAMIVPTATSPSNLVIGMPDLHILGESQAIQKLLIKRALQHIEPLSKRYVFAQRGLNSPSTRS